ncbi:hypothetical protein XA68_17128 [Ophiocordyceps unilateralis]|uniref:Uncharacterized protein n=1 Tax=Ophiocordyceps unilateralis TaxID=268505 RepID=A0A2A9P5A3_OPHUN|nr:hypothetical protein XA68_17128 [Ophiocordyceps unilateralis]
MSHLVQARFSRCCSWLTRPTRGCNDQNGKESRQVSCGVQHPSTHQPIRPFRPFSATAVREAASSLVAEFYAPSLLLGYADAREILALQPSSYLALVANQGCIDEFCPCPLVRGRRTLTGMTYGYPLLPMAYGVSNSNIGYAFSMGERIELSCLDTTAVGEVLNL